MVQRFAAVAMAGSCAWLVAAGVGRAQTCPPPGTATTACTGNCASISAPMASGAKGGTVDIPITFNQGPNDSQANSGFDDVAAIAFTLGVPGTGPDTPLTFTCTGGNIDPASIQAGSGDFNVVIENAQCAGRDHCLCPGDGQTRDNFVNIVAYGPKNLPEQGPVQIPRLNSGVLVTLKMNIAGNAPDSVPLRIFSAMDTDKPQFAANLSIGDQSACDVTASQSRSNVIFTQGSVMTNGITPTPGCVGDCNGDGMVLINELIIGVNIALNSQPVTACPAFDANHDGQVLINELIQGVNHALTGC